MSGGSDRPSSREVAHEAEDTRAHLASTLEQLRTNLRPENVVDEVMTNARAGAASVAESLSGVAKANPIPSILLAAGAMIVMGVMSRSGRRSGAASHDLLRDATTSGPYPVAAGEEPAAAGVRLDPDAGWAADGDRDAAPTALGSTTLGKGVERLRRGASDAYDAAASTTRDAAQSLSRYVPRDRREVKSQLSNLLDDQPLILGAIGLAVGAAIGAALPITETEDHLMGETSHQLRQAASDLARHEVQGLRTVAGETVNNIRQTVADHGVSRENFDGLVRDVGAEARAAVGKVGSHDV